MSKEMSKEISKQLAKCPLCGGEAKIDKTITNTVSVECTVCHASSRIILCTEGDIEQKAIEAWNTRKPIENMLERLEEQAEECRKYWQEFDDEDSFGGMNAYCDAVEIVKEEGGMK